MKTTLTFLPEKSHGQRSREACGPKGHRQSDTTKHKHFDVLLSSLQFTTEAGAPPDVWVALLLFLQFISQKGVSKFLLR